MGVKNFIQDLKTKVSQSRLFKALIVPRFTHHSIKIIEAFGGGLHFKYLRQRINTIDTENYVCKYTLVEGDMLGDKLQKICYEIKFEALEDEGSVIKLASEYHTKGDVELYDEEIQGRKEQALRL